MILQSNSVDLLINSVPFLVSFLLIVILFGALLYFAVFIWRIKELSEDFDANFLIRSLGVALIAALFVIFIEFIFVLIFAFSPVFKSNFNVDLLVSVLTTNIWAMIGDIFASPPEILFMAIVMIALIVLFNSLIMLEAYKVNFGWTTVVTWTAIGIFLGIDSLLSFVIEDGIAGALRLLGDSIYTIMQ